nr:probable pre-mRNA-splicing factor ATP-dependent RNA helicase DEAH4 isoform X2 [Tanacetum cinerariifolium]
IHVNEPEGDILIFMTGQIRVFSPPPKYCRHIIVATNIAETSLTVDGVVVQTNQRAGRARRTRPGKCYRLYPLTVYHDNLLEANAPEIQRSSLAGSVLYLKPLDLPDIDIMKFDFHDAPSLYFYWTELPLEPSLARTLVEANKNDCLPQALTVAAMLSVEGTLLPGRSKHTDKKRKQPPSELPDGSGWGDHIQLLQIYELWNQTDYSTEWVKDNNLQVRGMLFVKKVRKQLCQIMQKFAKGSLDVHPSSVLRTDDEGVFPNYVVYHELISTSHPYMRNVCEVEMEWVTPILQNLEKLNVKILSGGSNQPEEKITENSNVPKKDVKAATAADDTQSRILLLGFGLKWRAWIKGCLQNARSSVLVNGSPTEKFELFRGLRQGDPMSPFLFILAMEGLHALTRKAEALGLFKGASIGRDNLRISHLMARFTYRGIMFFMRGLSTSMCAITLPEKSWKQRQLKF